ncbi:MAG: glycine cleavage system protein GcvH [Ignavibacteriae bacterium]|nr:glycine cleavage system protein GcvH [Ignavibacteriota bacterium]MCB9216351.1 glycine cleavage system protein GcvH [Ignavibacteria bacterium]
MNNFPEGLKYVKSHEWAKVEGDTITIGITDFAQSELGDVVFVDITAAPGDTLNVGDVFGTIEAVKTVSDLYMPVGGTISAINENLGDAPESLNNDPYSDGWLIKVTEATVDENEMMDAAAYREMVGA